MTRPLTPSNYRQAVIELVTELFSPEDQDRWFLVPQAALHGEWPSLAMQKGKEEAVYKLLFRLKQGH